MSLASWNPCCPPAPGTAVLEGRVAEPVVGRALLRVRQDGIGLVAFLEADFRLRIAGVLVRVVLHGGLAKGALQLDLGAGAGDFQHLVIVTRHRLDVP